MNIKSLSADQIRLEIAKLAAIQNNGEAKSLTQEQLHLWARLESRLDFLEDENAFAL